MNSNVTIHHTRGGTKIHQTFAYEQPDWPPCAAGGIQPSTFKPSYQTPSFTFNATHSAPQNISNTLHPLASSRPSQLQGRLLLKQRPNCEHCMYIVIPCAISRLHHGLGRAYSPSKSLMYSHGPAVKYRGRSGRSRRKESAQTTKRHFEILLLVEGSLSMEFTTTGLWRGDLRRNSLQYCTPEACLTTDTSRDQEAMRPFPPPAA